MAARFMTQDDLLQINSIQKQRFNVTVDALKDKTDRTLIFGYSVERHTFHLYLKNGLFYALYYDSRHQLLSYRQGPTLGVDWVIPNKRVYPEACDNEFCRLIAPFLEHGIPFLPYNAKRNLMGVYIGAVMEELTFQKFNAVV